MPTLFIGHGSPMNAIEDNIHTRAWRQLGTSLPRPQAILAISAHWYTNGSGVTTAAQPRTIHDFYGFPPELFAQNYPAAGSGALARRVQELLRPDTVVEDHEWGLDHGSWSVLTHLYPQADVPVVQLSIDATRAPEYHYRLGQKLAALRDDGVLILGSGGIVHNLQRMRWEAGADDYAWAVSFDQYVRSALTRGDHQAVIEFEQIGEAAQLSVPTPEHYLPLLYVLGASSKSDEVAFPTEGIEMGSISMLSVLYS